MTDRIWILGAPDPEMELIERLLREIGESVVYATGEDGRRVHAGNAYRCPVPTVPEGATVYAVECIDALPEGWVRIDHHRPGDPGYGRPPAEFLPASSIGQVVWLLASEDCLPRDWEYAEIGTSFGEDHAELVGPRGRLRTLDRFGVDDLSAVGAPVALGSARDICVYDEPTGSWWVHWSFGACDAGSWDAAAKIPTDLVLIAAADHCLAAAYRGECPGVDPDALMRWRAASRAAFQRRPVEELLADIERAREALRTAPSVELMGVADMPHTEDHDWGRSVCDGCARDPVYARDMRGQHVPELPEASAREGICFIADGLPGPDGRVKVVCQSGTPEQIEAFMRVWAPAHGLTDIYGDPARGFAGGYLA